MSSSEGDLKQLLKALTFAAHKHRDQRRKDKESSPYINHPIALANILCNEGHISDIAVICAALLHDTVEDTDTTAEELERRRPCASSTRSSMLRISATRRSW